MSLLPESFDQGMQNHPVVGNGFYYWCNGFYYWFSLEAFDLETHLLETDTSLQDVFVLYRSTLDPLRALIIIASTNNNVKWDPFHLNNFEAICIPNRLLRLIQL